MKKLLPIIMFVLLAFAGCQRGPAMYTQSNNPKEFLTNSEKFVNQTVKRSSHYNAEDWQVAVDQFVAMAKNFVENKNSMTEEEIARYNNMRLDFMEAVHINGNADLTAQIKKVYGKIIQ